MIFGELYLINISVKADTTQGREVDSITIWPTNPVSGPEKILCFLGAQISTSCLPGKPVIFDPFYAAKLNPYSSYNWAEIVFNPTLSP